MLIFFWFFVGAILGSFGLLVIERTPKIGFPNCLFGRSMCSNCQHTLQPVDLIPIFSFALVGGKCRYCKKSIGIRHLLAEILFGLLGVALSLLNTNPVIIALNLVILSILIIIAGIDFQTQLIVEILVILVAVLVIIIHIITKTPFSEQVYGILAGAGIFAFLVFASRGKWMGVGDIEVGGALGLFLGYPNILFALFSAFVSGALYGVYLLQTKQAKLNSAIPFAPFLVFGGLVALFFGKFVLKWYLGGLN